MRCLVIATFVLTLVSTSLEVAEHEELGELLKELKTARRLTHTQRLRELVADVKDTSSEDLSPSERFWFHFNKKKRPKPKPKG